ncbi:MAG: DUF1801 domain-containing protein [Flavobacteriales bacterium]|nr:DUF1801 domain-containing protein [Flavobacteriales bacterium]
MKDERITAYIASFPATAQRYLKQLRKLIAENAPDAIETISYGMPAYKLNGKPLVYFAGYVHHIGFYATPTGHAAFKKELAGYKTGKGSVQFPMDESLPTALIARMVKFRVDEIHADTYRHLKANPASKRSKGASDKKQKTGLRTKKA